ncbi:MAG: M14 family metallopeptidase [Oceanicaulis sp.]
MIWSRVPLRLSALAGALALTACAVQPPQALQQTPSRQAGPVCIFGPLTLDARFPGGRLTACERLEDGAIQVTTAPENEPINPSAWYAFDLTCEECGPVTLELAYEGGEHRYPPMVAPVGSQGWPSPVGVAAEETRFTLDPGDSPLRISAQPLYTVDQHHQWLSQVAARTGGTVTEIGRSIEGAPILALLIGDDRPGLLLLGGQHPPETRGAYAFEAFTERLLADDPLARAWRSAYGLTLIPALNPDGLDAGHWRHNSAGVDLNRDWGVFAQPETRAVRDHLAQAGAPLMMIDFHGTRRDVLYTLPDSAGGAWPDFAPQLHGALIDRLGEAAPARSGSHRSGSGVSKGWFHDTYLIPTLTYEVGDATLLEDLQATAVASAEIIMALMLQPAQPEAATSPQPLRP